jgi:esterase/lipase superfamily enzyme
MEHVLYYPPINQPLHLEWLSEPDSVSASIITDDGATAHFSAGRPISLTFASPGASVHVHLRIVGPPGVSYRISIRARQDWWSDSAVIEGMIGSEGVVSRALIVPRDDEATFAARRAGASLESRREQSPRRPPDLTQIVPGAARESIPDTVSARPSTSVGFPMPRPDERTEKVQRRSEKGRYTVWFATNRRQRLSTRGKLVGFSGERDAVVHHGWCRVTIPESHRIGSTGSPWWKRLLARTDDRLRVASLRAVTEETFWHEIAKALRNVSADKRDAVVFLHGFNVSFQEAALRAAQLGFDLGISGVMAFYSWPSKGTLHAYPADEAAIEASEGFIADFLAGIASRSGADKVHIIAHSMGNRGLLRAVDRIAATAASRTSTPFNQIVLAAADVDQDTFRRLSVTYKQVAERTTMYVCSKDKAVEASHWLHDFPRAGLAPPVLVVPGIDTINVSNLDLTLLGHGYVAEARELLTDMHALLRQGSPPEQRFGLRQQKGPNGDFWTVGR